jgi:hypothetical protein
VHQSNPVYLFSSPLIVPDQDIWLHTHIRAYIFFNTRAQLPMECETCILSVSLGNAKNYFSVLKKADQRALISQVISQVKNCINLWVNYCENEAEYLKSLALFTSFTNRPYIKARLDECHSYIIYTYIANTWMQKKENLLLYNRLTKRNFDQCTSCIAKHENLSMKWGEMVVNPQQHMHNTLHTLHTLHTLNKKYNSRFTVKEGHHANNLDATQNWSITNTNEFASKYTEGVISFQWSRHGMCMIIRLSSRIWWVMLIIRDGNAPAVNSENDIHGSDKYEWWNGSKDIPFLSVIVVTSIELACRVDTYSTLRARFT